MKNPNQLNIFDPRFFVTPQRRQMLDAEWPGLFREHILPSIPVNEVSKYFNATFGRPAKEFYSMPGALILQQRFTRLVRCAAFHKEFNRAGKIDLTATKNQNTHE